MTTQTDLAQALRDLVELKFKSGNTVPVDRVTITRAEYTALAAHDRQREAGEAEPVAWMWRCKGFCEWPKWAVSQKRPADAGHISGKPTPGYEDKPLYLHSSEARTASGVQTAVTSEAVRELVTKWRDRSDELPRDDLVSLTHRLKLRDCADELAAALGPQPVRLSESPCCGGRIITHGEVCGYCGKRAGPQPVEGVER